MINLEKLYGPYAKDASLEMTLTWLTRKAGELGISDDVKETAITEVFLEIADGKTFATDGGDTGFTHSHAVLNHYLLAKMIILNKEILKAISDRLTDRINVRLLNRIQRKNKAPSIWNTPISQLFRRK